MSYYWFNRQELLQKAKDKYSCGGKERAADYYIANKDVIKEICQRNLKLLQHPVRVNMVRFKLRVRKLCHLNTKFIGPSISQ